ncbi:MAG: hypothetical protein ACE5JL_11210, partial [Dehalococcoidia bacterium]
VRDGYCVPPANPIPPVMVAGLGPVSARNAARVGDGWNSEGPKIWHGGGANPKFYRLKEIVLKELERVGRPRESFEFSTQEDFDEDFRRAPIERLSQVEKEGIDRVILDVYPPFDASAIASAGKAIYG